MFPSIDPREVGTTGLLWLFATYAYVLYYASSLIGQGSELLLLVPSMAGLIGGIVLPVLGAVPDGAIILFSGLGSKEEAQDSLSVGVGALAGSTIMLLTVTFALSIFGGRVDMTPGGMPNYSSKPKLTQKDNIIREFLATGVATSKSVKKGGKIMALTTIPFFLIQIPASFIHGPAEEVSEKEHWFALIGLIICVVGLVAYMKLQLRISHEGRDQEKRVAAVKKLLQEGKVSLVGALGAAIAEPDALFKPKSAKSGPEYRECEVDNDSDDSETNDVLPHKVCDYLKEVLKDAFMGYAKDCNGRLEKKEVFTFFRDFNETITYDDMNRLFQQFDEDENGALSLNEFIAMAYTYIVEREKTETNNSLTPRSKGEIVKSLWCDNEEQEEEEVPEEFTNLPPDQQQRAIKLRAFFMLLVGSVVAVVFSDAMVNVMQEIAVRVGAPPFYVSFILAPLASNLSEVVTSFYYASKKTSKSMSVSLTALEGAASMNNTLCLSIFMGLIFFRGLAWEYTAETIVILLVEFIIAAVVQKDTLTLLEAAAIGMIFPLSIAFVAFLESFGLD